MRIRQKCFIAHLLLERWKLESLVMLWMYLLLMMMMMTPRRIDQAFDGVGVVVVVMVSHANDSATFDLGSFNPESISTCHSARGHLIHMAGFLISETKKLHFLQQTTNI